MKWPLISKQKNQFQKNFWCPSLPVPSTEIRLCTVVRPKKNSISVYIIMVLYAIWHALWGKLINDLKGKYARTSTMCQYTTS
jgi:hypothetical protein